MDFYTTTAALIGHIELLQNVEKHLSSVHYISKRYYYSALTGLLNVKFRYDLLLVIFFSIVQNLSDKKQVNKGCADIPIPADYPGTHTGSKSQLRVWYEYRRIHVA